MCACVYVCASDCCSYFVLLHFNANKVYYRCIFFAKIQAPPFSDGRCAETRRDSWETKATGITTISRLPSRPCLVKFGSGEFEL